ncbi:MAG TPA: tripartite tricarboxylate transporter substrate binding protein [Bradyrhizobium sp.]|uniref:Bug family tripartite tricarboxylate transporter substrate binding protein n=1 Tax=Bradyrhizobium sp. TaxID=376 RepID=UPI002BDD66F9|nr:tripartite tricarboxylate transporter substrate binding protein [Bradyrhizobium sp.]HLZ03326.1 tripartite tricarboxylate transporter substrate binding protein [Bradyrhizobium sp.]
MHRRELLGLAAVLAGARVLSRVQPVRAQSLAGKQIRVVVPFPPGGPTDIVARPFAQMLGEALQATMIVDNRAGAGGSIGAELAAQSAPDGQTLLVGTVGTHAINSALYAKLPYDPVKDFTPLALIALAPVAVVVHPLVQAKSLADLVALAKKNPNKLNYGSAGIGTPGHLTAEMFRAASGIDIQHVPYKGSAPALTDLIAGQIQIMFDPLQSVLSNVKGGKIRALAVSSKTRAPVVPDVPTIAESGYDGFETTAWWGVFAPASLPDALTTSLVTEIERIVASDTFRSKLEPLGVTAVADIGGSAFADFQKNEIAKWGKAVRDAHVKIN